MTGPEHYREAERLMASGTMPGSIKGSVVTVTPAPGVLALAQVHAALALAAATALCTPNADGIIDPNEYNAWHKIAAVDGGAS